MCEYFMGPLIMDFVYSADDANYLKKMCLQQNKTWGSIIIDKHLC